MTLDDDVFAYILEKNVVEQSKCSILIGDLKAQISKFKCTTVDPAKAVYLGFLDKPCDSTLTVKHVLEKLYDIFKV